MAKLGPWHVDSVGDWVRDLPNGSFGLAVCGPDDPGETWRWLASYTIDPKCAASDTGLPSRAEARDAADAWARSEGHVLYDGVWLGVAVPKAPAVDPGPARVGDGYPRLHRCNAVRAVGEMPCYRPGGHAGNHIAVGDGVAGDATFVWPRDDAPSPPTATRGQWDADVAAYYSCPGPSPVPALAGAASVDATNPAHYRAHPSGVECIEVTRHMNFNRGNAMKYIWRAGAKGVGGPDGPGAVEDLAKAAWYIADEIARLTKGE